MLQKIDENNEVLIVQRAKPKLQRGGQAKEVFVGKLFHVWQWPQKLYDGSETIFEGLSRVDTVTVLATTPDGQVIITKQSQPGLDEFWSMPGGLMDEGETVLTAAKRELLEETGYSSQDWYFLFSSQMSGKIDWANFYLVAKNCLPTAARKPDPGEKIELELLSLEQFEQLTKREDFRQNDFALWMFRNEVNLDELLR